MPLGPVPTAPTTYQCVNLEVPADTKYHIYRWGWHAGSRLWIQRAIWHEHGATVSCRHLCWRSRCKTVHQSVTRVMLLIQDENTLPSPPWPPTPRQLATKSRAFRQLYRTC